MGDAARSRRARRPRLGATLSGAEAALAGGDGARARWPELGGRTRDLREAYRACRLCPRDCGVDRLAGAAGYCRLDARAPCYKALLSHGEEALLCPTVLLDLGGCSLRCLGCTEWDHVVDPWRSPAVALDASWLVPRLQRWVASGARSLSIVGGEPTMHLLAVAETLAAVPVPLQLPLVWNTNGLLAAAARDALLDWVACWVVDLKVADGDDARRLLGAGGLGYVDEVVRTLDAIAARPTDALPSGEIDALPRLIIRHLLVPGELERNTLPLLERFAARWPEATWNLMTGWLPHGPALSATAGPDTLRRTLAPAEREAAIAAASGALGPRLLVDGRPFVA